MGLFGIATYYRAGKYRNGQKIVSISTITESGDPKTSMNAFSPGIEINPANGENLVFTRIKNSSSFLVTIGGINQKIAPDTDRGERRIYSVSSDGETIKAIAKFKNDGVLELNGATDSAVKFADLKTGFDALVTFVNAHIHPFVGLAPGVPGTTAATTPGSTADIDGAESADIKLS